MPGGTFPVATTTSLLQTVPVVNLSQASRLVQMLPIKSVITTKVVDEAIIPTAARKVPSRVTADSCRAIMTTLVTLPASAALMKGSESNMKPDG